MLFRSHRAAQYHEHIEGIAFRQRIIRKKTRDGNDGSMRREHGREGTGVFVRDMLKNVDAERHTGNLLEPGG